MNKKIANKKNIAKFAVFLFWASLERIRYLPFVIVIIMIITIMALIIPSIQEKKFILYNDINLTLSIISSILAGAIIFLIVEFFSRVFIAGKKESSEIYYDKLFIEQGLESIFSSRGINQVYKDKILKARYRIWAVGMTNGNLIAHQLDNIINRISIIENIEVVISFWSESSSFKKTYNNQKEISIINQQLLIEDGKEISQKLIRDRYSKIEKEYKDSKNPKSGRLKIVEMTLPSNFTCFIIDDDVFFFPFLSTVESTSSPTILSNINRGVGNEIFKHVEKVLSEVEVTRIIYDSKNEKQI
jgi:hypothetical protein